MSEPKPWDEMTGEEKANEFELTYAANRLRSQHDVRRRQVRDPLAELRRRRTTYEMKVGEESGPWDETVAIRTVGARDARITDG